MSFSFDAQLVCGLGVTRRMEAIQVTRYDPVTGKPGLTLTQVDRIEFGGRDFSDEEWEKETQRLEAAGLEQVGIGCDRDEGLTHIFGETVGDRLEMDNPEAEIGLQDFADADRNVRRTLEKLGYQAAPKFWNTLSGG